MVDQIVDCLDGYLRYANQLEREQWIYVFAAILIFGIFCLRGYGSRRHY